MPYTMLEYTDINNPKMGCYVILDDSGFVRFSDPDIDASLVPYNTFAFKKELEMVVGTKLSLTRAFGPKGEFVDIATIPEKLV